MEDCRLLTQDGLLRGAQGHLGAREPGMAEGLALLGGEGSVNRRMETSLCVVSQVGENTQPGAAGVQGDVCVHVCVPSAGCSFWPSPSFPAMTSGCGEGPLGPPISAEWAQGDPALGLEHHEP